MPNARKTCSSCHGSLEERRANQSYCRACHRVHQKAWRAKKLDKERGHGKAVWLELEDGLRIAALISPRRKSQTGIPEEKP
jgi:hypothetical protein